MRAAWLAQWRYQGGHRDLRLDLLRGFAAFAMVVDHIGGDRSWLYSVTGGNRFFVSAGEAFVLISGVVLGIVYAGITERTGIVSALLKALGRAWSLYLVTVVLTLSFAVLGWWLGLWWAPDLHGQGVGAYILNVLTLHRTVFLADIMLMYTLLLLIAGPVVLLLSQHQTALVLGVSWLVWGVWQLAPQSVALPWPIEGDVMFHLPSWQVLFVTGTVVGWHWDTLRAALRRLPVVVLDAAIGVAAVSVVLFYVVQLTFGDALRRNALLGVVVYDKPDMPIGRLVVLALLGIFAFSVLTRCWRPIHAAVGWLLLPLGRNALLAYSLHLYVVVIGAWLAVSPYRGIFEHPASTAVVQLAGVMLVWLAVMLRSYAQTYVRGGLAALHDATRPHRPGPPAATGSRHAAR